MVKETSKPTDPTFELFCRHPDYAGTRVDFSEFAKGAPDVVPNNGANKWLGGFRGRPMLAAELAPALNLDIGHCKPRHMARRLMSFRGFWRMLDQLERDGLASVDSLADLSTYHGTQWLRWKHQPTASDYATVRGILETARELAEMEPLAWMTRRRTKQKLGDVATPEQAHRVYLALKRRVYEVYDRWRDADLLAQYGRNLLDIPSSDRIPPSRVSAADLHATYRALIARTGNPMPSCQALIEAMGYSASQKNGSPRQLGDVFFKAKVGIRELWQGLYPDLLTVQHFFYLFLIQTGWNVQVALDLDVSGPGWAVNIGDPSAEIYRISSFKVRSRTWQRTISRGKPTHSPYQLIKRLTERTALLRKAAVAGTVGCVVPTIAQRSPWLHCGYTQEPAIHALDDKSYLRQHRERETYLRRLAKEINQAAAHDPEQANQVEPREGGTSPVLVPNDMRASDFRDIFIGNEFLQSGYNLVIAKLAAGHTSMASVRRYLFTRAWRRHGEGSVRRLMDHLWGEIEVHRVCDPAMLRALCDRGVVTDEQRERWARGKDKTYLGMGCVSPRHPPKHIDPTHAAGKICRNQQRCTLCEHGILMPDSLPDLCKRLAELEVLRAQMSLSVWKRAESLQVERDVLIQTLAQFDTVSVEEQVRFWEVEIKQGRHDILEWDGVHEI
ncbi:hypothetical protein FHR55_003515 [Xanthomonas arboricola]